MSWQLELLRGLSRIFVKRRLRKAAEPQDAEDIFERFAARVFRKPPFLCHLVEEGTIPLNWISSGQVHPYRVILFIHGGGFVAGSGQSYAALAGRISRLSKIRVCLPEYRLSQVAAFPGAVHDVRKAWDILRAKGYAIDDIIIMGDSAGGNLALGLLSNLLTAGEKPVALVVFSPWTDMTKSGESLVTHAARDPILPAERMDDVISLYLEGADPLDKMASPLFSEFPNPPPTLFQVGSEEILLSDSIRMSEKLGGELSVWDGCPHVWQILDGYVPEARSALKEAALFIQNAFERTER